MEKTGNLFLYPAIELIRAHTPGYAPWISQNLRGAMDALYGASNLHKTQN
jgi:hypothetical protein